MRSWLAALFVVVAACNSEKATAPGSLGGRLEGSWSLARWESIGTSDTTQRRDELAQGIALLLDVGVGGAVTETIILPTMDTLRAGGTLAFRGDTLLVQVGSAQGLYFVTLTADRMTWRGVYTYYTDLTGSGSLGEEATEEKEWVRR